MNNQLSEQAKLECDNVLELFYKYVNKKLIKTKNEQQKIVDKQSGRHIALEMYRTELNEILLFIKQQRDRIKHDGEKYALKLEDTMLYQRVYDMIEMPRIVETKESLEQKKKILLNRQKNNGKNTALHKTIK